MTEPTPTPTSTPTPEPTEEPTVGPTPEPTAEPTPTVEPTPEPTIVPPTEPTESADAPVLSRPRLELRGRGEAATEEPTAEPTEEPEPVATFPGFPVEPVPVDAPAQLAYTGLESVLLVFALTLVAGGAAVLRLARGGDAAST